MSLAQTKDNSAPNGGTATMVVSTNNLHKDPIRYSDEELEEFRGIILKKKEDAEEIINFNASVIANIEGNKSEASSFAKIDDDYDLEAKENAQMEIKRQQEFIEKLKWALVRIDNKTYGICHASRILIDKDRLRLVPHATLSIQVKNSRNRLN